MMKLIKMIPTVKKDPPQNKDDYQLDDETRRAIRRAVEESFRPLMKTN